MSPRPSPPRLWVCVPGVQGRAWQSGGLLIVLRAAELFGAHLPTAVVTTHDAEPPLLGLDEALAEAGPTDMFLVTWGPHVTDLLHRLTLGVGQPFEYLSASGALLERLKHPAEALEFRRARVQDD